MAAAKLLDSDALTKIRARVMIGSGGDEHRMLPALLGHVDAQNALLLRAWAVLASIGEHEDSAERGAQIPQHVLDDVARVGLDIAEAIDVPNDGINALFAIKIDDLFREVGVDCYVVSYDVAALNSDGIYSGGDIKVTDQIKEAMHGTLEECIKLYRSESPHGPRLDGKPDRPLTVFAAEFVRVRPEDLRDQVAKPI